MMWIEGEVPVRMNPERRFVLKARVGVALLLAMACSSGVFAGNIFMKNGYIIQGRIVDRDADSVILGWPNGKVAIARRFVESVEYEHAEEERIRELEQARQERPEEEDTYQPSALASGTDEGELPASLEMFIQKYQLEPLKHATGDFEDPQDSASLLSGTDVTDPGGTDPLTGEDPMGSDATDLVPDVNQIGSQLGEEVESESARLALRPPKTWVRREQADFLAFTSDEGEGLRASVNVVSMDRGPLSAEDFVELLRTQQEATLQDFEVMEEGPTNVGTQPAYEIAGQCSYRNEPAVVRQILVLIGDRVWLFSAFAPESADSAASVDDTMALVDEMLGSVAFRTDASMSAPERPQPGATGSEPDDVESHDADVDLDDMDLDDMDLDGVDLDGVDLDGVDLDDVNLDDVDVDDVDLDDVNLDDVDVDDVDLNDVDLDDLDLDVDTDR